MKTAISAIAEVIKRGGAWVDKGWNRGKFFK